MPDVLTPRSAVGFQAFAVADDLKLNGKKAPAKASAAATVTSGVKSNSRKVAAPAKGAAAPLTIKPAVGNKPAVSSKPAVSNAAAEGPAAAAAKSGKRPLPIQLGAVADADPEVAWNDYFATHESVATDSVRQTARDLMRARKYGEVVAMIRAALRNGQPQPWMYEAMGLAMQAAGSTKAEVERALMSAIDFGDSSEDLLYVAQYMARSGLESRALKVFQQVAMIEPLRPESYLYGLQLAQRMNDLEGIRWSSLGILKQAWPRDKQNVVQSATRAAADAVVQLRQQNRAREADAFQAEIDKAKIRDCLVKVTWTGDADVDILVQEPSGTVCSFRNPRTTGGGVILGDSGPADSRSGSLSETYVCPEAFNGTYHVRVRRVWGKLAAGKVTVEVYSHYGAKDQKYLRSQIAVGDLDSLVVFDLKDGRRREPLAEQQVANAAAGQIAVNQLILAQQLNSLAGSQSAISGLGASRGGLLGFPFIQQAVGYMPVIQSFPSGAFLTTSGVISADRRYVRVSPSPMFMQIGQVTTYNLQMGSIATTNGANQQGGNGAADRIQSRRWRSAGLAAC